jgi:hypothetical protein
MPGKNLKQTTQKSEPVVEAAPQKGGKKTTATKVEATPVVETAPQKGGKKATPVKVEAAPVPTKVEATPQKGGKKTTAAPAKVEATVTATKGVKKAPVVAAKTELKGGKKTATPKTEKKLTKKAETDVEAEGEEGDRHVRSFKVKLPGKEEFEGRFTGLTPYQAANKALSKYFRETEKPLTKITFSICESTRKSKKATYTYIGQRQKLEKPVTYKIQDGREIVKNFKNSLKKVKKSETSESA